MTDRNTIRVLKQVLSEGFNLEDLNQLCDQLNIELEDFPSTKTKYINLDVRVNR